MYLLIFRYENQKDKNKYYLTGDYLNEGFIDKCCFEFEFHVLHTFVLCNFMTRSIEIYKGIGMEDQRWQEGKNEE